MQIPKDKNPAHVTLSTAHEVTKKGKKAQLEVTAPIFTGAKNTKASPLTKHTVTIESSSSAIPSADKSIRNAARSLNEAGIKVWHKR